MRFRCFIAAALALVFLPASLFALTLDEEKKYGREVYGEISRSEKLFFDPYISIYMSIIKSRLEAAADLPLPIKLTIINSPTLNAFATVGGYVFMTTGILEQADKEEEVAGVLAHEFGHVGKRHVSKALEKDKYHHLGHDGHNAPRASRPGRSRGKGRRHGQRHGGGRGRGAEILPGERRRGRQGRSRDCREGGL